MIDSEEYLNQLALEDKYTPVPPAWLLAQAFQENRNEICSIRAVLAKELDSYKPWLRKHPFNRCFMMVDPRTRIINDIDKFLNFTKSIDKPADNGNITQADIERAKLVPIESLYTFRRKGKKVFCPFHDDKRNPSAALYDNKFHCFTCGIDLDTIEFVRKLHGLSFVEAVKSLTK